MKKHFAVALILLVDTSHIKCDFWDWLHKSITQPIQQNIIHPIQTTLAPQNLAHDTEQAQRAVQKAAQDAARLAKQTQERAAQALEDSHKNAIAQLKGTPEALQEASKALHASAAQLGDAPKQLAIIPSSLDQTFLDLKAQQKSLSKNIQDTLTQKNDVVSMQKNIESMDIPIQGVKKNMINGLDHLITSLNLLYGSLSTLQARLIIILASTFPDYLQKIKSKLKSLVAIAPAAKKNLNDFADRVDNLSKILVPLTGLAQSLETISFVPAPAKPPLTFTETKIKYTTSTSSNIMSTSTKNQTPQLMPLGNAPKDQTKQSAKIWKNRAQLHSTVNQIQKLKISLISMHENFQVSIINKSTTLINSTIKPKQQTVATAQKYVTTAENQINVVQNYESIIFPLTLMSEIALEEIIEDLRKKIEPIKESLGSIETLFDLTSNTLELVMTTFLPTIQSFDPASAPVYVSINESIRHLIRAENLMAQTENDLEYLGL